MFLLIARVFSAHSNQGNGWRQLGETRPVDDLAPMAPLRRDLHGRALDEQTAAGEKDVQITAISCKYPAKKVQATCDPYQLPQTKAVESGQPAQNLPFSCSWFCSCVPSLNPLRGKSLHLGRKLKGLC